MTIIRQSFHTILYCCQPIRILEMTIEIEAELLGPFKHPKPRVARSPSFEESGIYIWTIPWEGRFLVNYVGETGTSFAKRNLEHRGEYYVGDYRVYDPNKFRKGDKEIKWGGMWWFKKYISNKPLLDLIKQFMDDNKGNYDDDIEKLLKCFSIFLIPLIYPNESSPKLKENDRIRMRIEGGLVRTLASDPEVFKFQDFGAIGNYSHRDKDEEVIRFHLKNANKIIGLDENVMEF